MADLLDAYDEGGEMEGEVKAPAVYLNQKQQQDFIARVGFAGFGVHENEESEKNGQPFFRIELTVTEVNGGAWGDRRKAGGGYEAVELRPGDKTSIYVYNSAVGVKKSTKNQNFRTMTELAAAFSGERASDYLPASQGGRLGPQAIREVFGDGTLHEGKLVHILGTEENAKGYTNPTLSVIPTAPAKRKK